MWIVDLIFLHYIKKFITEIKTHARRLYAVKGNVIPITANTLRGSKAIKILSGNVNMN